MEFKISVSVLVAAVGRMDEAQRVVLGLGNGGRLLRRFGSLENALRDPRLIPDVGTIRTFFCDDVLDAMVADYDPDTPLMVTG
jgi:hypothetical protein